MVVYRPGAADGGMEGLCLSLVTCVYHSCPQQLSQSESNYVRQHRCSVAQYERE